MLKTFLVTFSSEAGDLPECDDVRDMILDACGFPLIYDQHPEYLTVEDHDAEV